jgi:long-chain fatty acid transport protein
VQTQHLLSKWPIFILGAFFLVAVGVSPASAQIGPFLSGTGAIDRSMGGAATAAPLSAAGALYWNPATMPGLGRSQLEAGAELLFPHTQASSQISAGALGPGGPPVGLEGQTNSDTGAYPLPTISLVYLPEGSDWSFGLGIFAVAGFGVDYSGSTTNFPLTAPPPNGVGFGPVFSNFEVLQIHPAVAYQLMDHLTVAAGPTLDIGKLQMTPAIFAAPDNASGNSFATYPTATHSETTWGGGFDAGVYYQATTWAAGASVKSPQWFDKLRYDSADQIGRPRELDVTIDLPMIVSVGAAYTGLEHWMFATDVRYLDFRDTRFLGDEGFNPDGSVRGLGWKSVFAVATGVQYQMTDALSLRLGYSWNQNPIPDSQSFINTVAPVTIEHMLYAGASWKVNEDFILSVAYVHAFENSITGPLVSTAGPVAETSVRNATSGDSVLLSLTVKFGAPR